VTSIFAGMSLGYVIGSIPFSQMIAHWRSGADLRVHGYRNVGAYNVVRTVGISWGLLAGLLDAGKGMVVLAMAHGLGISHPLDHYMGLCAVVGHNYPIWLGFKGGKGVMVIVGLLFWTAPLETVLAVMISFAVFWMVRFVYMSVACGTVVLILLTRYFDHFERIQILIYGAMILIGLAYLPRFLHWLYEKIF